MPGSEMIFKPAPKGFTLVELLMVTALLSVVLLAVFSTYSSGIRIWREVKDAGILDKRELYTSLEKMKRELMGHIRDFTHIEFEGSHGKLIFPAVSKEGVMHTTYYFDKSASTFFKESYRFSDSLKEKMDKEKREAFSADEVKFSYLFYDPEKETGVWMTDFEEAKEGVPEAVRLDIRIAEEELNEYIFIPR